MNLIKQSLHMHGYALYIWPAYGFVFGLLITNLLNTWWRGKRTRAELRAWLKSS